MSHACHMPHQTWTCSFNHTSCFYCYLTVCCSVHSLLQMAEEALKKLEEELNCSICLDTYTDPKQLQCFHVYCRKCLVPLVAKDQQGQLSVSCPACRQVTPVPAKGIGDLQSAFLVNRLLEIQKSYQRVEKAPGTPEVATPTDRIPASFCSVHEGKRLELFCETCKELICLKCALKGEKHHTHNYKELEEAFKRYQEEMQLSLEPLEQQVKVITAALAELDTRCQEISKQQAATAVNIHSTFRRLQEALSVRETELIGQLERITQDKQKELAAQRDKAETVSVQLHSCLHFVRESLRAGSEGGVLMMKANTVRQVEKLTTPFQSGLLKPCTKADVVFTASADMAGTCLKYAQVFVPGSPDPSQCLVTSAAAATAGEMATAILDVFNCLKEPCRESIRSLECKLVSELTGAIGSCGVVCTGQSRYEISYQPTVKGKHLLHITVGDQHIWRSPLSIAVKQPIQKLGTPILTASGMFKPLKVALTPSGGFVVTESIGHCVSVFSPRGEKIRSFGRHGSGHGEFKYPGAVAVDGEGNLLVGDRHGIQKFTLEGQFLASVDIASTIDLAYNASNRMVYAGSWLSDHISVLNSDLKLIGNKFGRQFHHPCGISFDSIGNVYVADEGNNRIQVFKADGKHLRTFGRHGCGRGELDSPIGVAIDSSDRVYVSEGGNHRVSVFTSKGEFVTSFGCMGDGPGEFVSPVGIAVDSNGVVYVCDHDRVQLF